MRTEVTGVFSSWETFASSLIRRAARRRCRSMARAVVSTATPTMARTPTRRSRRRVARRSMLSRRAGRVGSSMTRVASGAPSAERSGSPSGGSHRAVRGERGDGSSVSTRSTRSSTGKEPIVARAGSAARTRCPSTRRGRATPSGDRTERTIRWSSRRSSSSARKPGASSLQPTRTEKRRWRAARVWGATSSRRRERSSSVTGTDPGGRASAASRSTGGAAPRAGEGKAASARSTDSPQAAIVGTSRAMRPAARRRRARSIPSAGSGEGAGVSGDARGRVRASIARSGSPAAARRSPVARAASMRGEVERSGIAAPGARGSTAPSAVSHQRVPRPSSRSSAASSVRSSLPSSTRPRASRVREPSASSRRRS